MYKEKDGTVRFEKTKDRREFKRQLEDFSAQAQMGKRICLTDLLINAEIQHLESTKKTGRSNGLE